MPITASLIGAGGAILGGGIGAFGASKAAGQTKSAQKRQFAFSREMLGRAEGYLNPYSDAGKNALSQYRDFNASGAGRDYLQQMGDLGLNLEYKDDPAYQWRMRKQEEAINRAMAARGNYNSRYGVNALADANMALSGQEADKQYGRALDTYNRDYADLANRYGLEYGHLGNLVGMGQNAATQLGGFATGTGGQMVNSSANMAPQIAAQTQGMYGGIAQGIAGASAIPMQYQAMKQNQQTNNALTNYYQNQNPYTGPLSPGYQYFK